MIVKSSLSPFFRTFPNFKRARLYKTHPSSPTQTDEGLALLNPGIKMRHREAGMSPHIDIEQGTLDFACGAPFLGG
jgi:hypothetical protein